MFVSATYDREKKTVHYFDEDGSETLYIGGSFAWRTNNPGNVTKPTTYVMSGAIGYALRTSNSKVPFVIFPDRATGMAAHKNVLKSVYGDSSIKGMITKYAPPSENDTEKYIDTVTKSARVSSNDIVGKLPDDKFGVVMAVMEKQEGWIHGVIKQLGKPVQIQLVDKVNKPFSDQRVSIKSGEKSFDTTSDPSGQLPWLYSGLLGKEINLYYAREKDDQERIGTLSAGSNSAAYIFTAPYYLLTSQPRVHETEERSRPKVHIVQSGETLSSIASKYGATVGAIVQENALTDPNHIYARQHIRIPKSGEVTVSDAAPPKNDTASQKIEAASPKAPEVNKPRPVEAINGRSNGSSQPNIEHGSSTVVKSPRNTVNVTNQRNQNSHPETVVSSAQLELSGTVWCSRFPGLKSLDSLDALFKAKVDAFFSALKEAGITSGDIKIGATYRPLERSYLMYNAFFIAKGRISPDKVERFNGVNIDWVHRGTDGKMDLEESKKAAREMCGGYGLNLNSAKQTVGKPGSSRHNYRAAIDMTIHNYSKKKVKDANGDEIELKSFADLVKVGRSYGVRYFPAENMHWSDTGH